MLYQLSYPTRIGVTTPGKTWVLSALPTELPIRRCRGSDKNQS